MDRIAGRAPQYPDADRGCGIPGQARLLRVDWPLDPSRTHAAVSADRRRTGISGDFHRFVAFGAGGRRNARPAEPAPWPGRSPWGFSSGSFCFCGLGGGVVLWRASRPEFRRIRALHGVFGLGAWSCPVSSGFSTLLWSPMCAAAGPPRWSPGAACWREAFGIHWWDAMCLPVVFWGRLRPLLEDWCGLFPPGSAILRRNHLRVQQWQFLGARTIIADISNILIVAPIFWLAVLFVLVLLRALLRKEWAAAVAWVLLFTVFFAAGSQFAPVVLVGSSDLYWSGCVSADPLRLAGSGG